MKTKKIITGITIAEQMRRAKKILKNQVIPKERLYQKNHTQCIIYDSLEARADTMSLG